MGDTVMNVLGAGGFKLSKKPMDPLNTSTPYTYSKLYYGTAFQIKADWEGDSVAFYSPHSYALVPPSAEWDHGGVFGIPEAEAASGNPALAYIKGNYNGMVAKTQTGSTVYYLLAVPSIITTLSGALDVTKFLIHGQTNSGGLANAVNVSKFVIYSSGALPSNDSERILFASGLALAYSGTNLASQSDIASFISAGNNTGTLALLGGSLLSASLGGNASSQQQTPPPATTTFSLSSTSVTA